MLSLFEFYNVPRVPILLLGVHDVIGLHVVRSKLRLLHLLSIWGYASLSLWHRTPSPYLFLVIMCNRSSIHHLIRCMYLDYIMFLVAVVINW
jgi:hypothetical protein